MNVFDAFLSVFASRDVGRQPPAAGVVMSAPPKGGTGGVRPLAWSEPVHIPPKPPSRFEPRVFLIDPRTGLEEVRCVDVLALDALIPVGTRIVCEAGHDIGRMTESVHAYQQVPAEAVGEYRPFQGVSRVAYHPHYGKNLLRFGPCLCGADWATDGQFHTPDGWTGAAR